VPTSNIHIGKLINKVWKQKNISIEQTLDFLKCNEEDVCKMLKRKSINTDRLFKWSRLLEYDFFKIYSQPLNFFTSETSEECATTNIKILNANNIQSALMEEFESKIRKEEQERMSQNLHDDLAGTLAAIKNNIDLLIGETEENEKRNKLTQLSDMVKTAFHDVRNKSHELFETAQSSDEGMFYKHITHLAQIIFPDKHYKLSIQIDNYAMVNTSMELQLELVSVIQEAFTNIVKHAKATRIDLLIYKEAGKLFVIIKDNGEGLKAKVKQNTLGINNMKKRLKRFNAVFFLHNYDNGLEIIISIPENPAKPILPDQTDIFC